MTRIKKKRWILLSVLVGLVAAGVVIWLLTPPQQRTLTVEEHQEEAPPPADDSWMEDVRPIAENLPDMTYEEVQSQIDILRAQLEAREEEVLIITPPRNYQMKAPPPSADQLQPGATTEVEPLVYEKPLLSLTPLPDDPLYYCFDPFDNLVMYYMELHGMVDYHNLEKISVEEALQAEYLYLMWEFVGPACRHSTGLSGGVLPDFRLRTHDGDRSDPGDLHADQFCHPRRKIAAVFAVNARNIPTGPSLA